MVATLICHCPITSLRLIQACGRLLRTETDMGTVSILDKRLLTKRYGAEVTTHYHHLATNN